ncbi:MAG: Thermophilic serine proteinase [Thermoleophilia bacterium]|nr:Thermophilic serine proteinase [Thermoleophilia bacterium]
MLRPPRRRLARSVLALGLLLCMAVAVAQLAGVGGRGGAAPDRLVFEGTHERWLVQGASAAKLDTAARRLGGGKAGAELAGGWHEVDLGDEVAARQAEAAFADVGATAVEPVLPRLPYDTPDAPEDPAPATGARTGTADAPGSHDDGIGSTVGGTELRNGPVGAPRIGDQWALSQSSDQDVDGPESWQVGTGAGAVVAVIDTGVDASHPDLAGRVLPGRDFSGSSTGAQVDRVGHGTAVASIIAASGAGMAGLAPDARIMPLKVFRDSAGGFSMSGYLAAIRYAADEGADVINISLGCGGTTSCFSQAELDAIAYANAKGTIVIAAAGNGDSAGQGMNNDAPETPDFPSGYELPGILSVTSSSRLGNWSSWSNYGATGVDIAAPGEGILTAAPGNAYRTVTGTSFSAPYASGAAALIAAAHPEATAADLRARLISSVVPTSSLRSRTVSGGILNANAAMFAIGAAEGGGPGLDGARLDAPRAGGLVGAPPVLAWSLPAGWSSAKVLLTGGGARHDRAVAAGARALAHPTSAWRSGTYRWQVVARNGEGQLVTSAPRTYRIAPRLGAWVTSGAVRAGGRSARLRIGYAATEPSANVQVIVRVGTRVLHSGRSLPRTSHLRGTGSPRRGWFAYDARLSRGLRIGERVTVEVRVRAGGTAIVRRFRASVA